MLQHFCNLQLIAVAAIAMLVLSIPPALISPVCFMNSNPVLSRNPFVIQCFCKLRLIAVAAVALRLLDTDRYQIGPLWFMSANPAYRSYASGYKIIMYICTLLTLPLTLLTKTLGSSAVVLLCCKHPNKSGQ